MPRKEELYMNKTQVQKLCELYQEEEHLWNIQSPHYFKKEKRNAALNRIKDGLEAEHDDLPNFTSEKNVISIGKGEPAPISIEYYVDQMANGKGFIVDVKIKICLPIDSEVYCIPQNGFHLLQRQQFPVCAKDFFDCMKDIGVSSHHQGILFWFFGFFIFVPY